MPTTTATADRGAGIFTPSQEANHLPRAAVADGLVVVGADRRKKSAWGHLSWRPDFVVKLGEGKKQLVLGPGDRNVKQADFFVEISFFDGPVQREHTVGQTEDEHDGEFEPLGLVNGGQPDRLLAGFDGAVAGFGVEA